MDSAVPLLEAVNHIASEYHWSVMSLLEQYLQKVRKPCSCLNIGREEQR